MREKRLAGGQKASSGQSSVRDILGGVSQLLVQYEGVAPSGLQVGARRDLRRPIIRQFIWKCGPCRLGSGLAGGGLLPKSRSSQGRRVAPPPGTVPLSSHTLSPVVKLNSD